MVTATYGDRCRSLCNSRWSILYYSACLEQDRIVHQLLAKVLEEFFSVFDPITNKKIIDYTDEVNRDEYIHMY